MPRINDDLGAALADLAKAHADLRDHASSATYRLVRDWLDAVAAAQQAGMIQQKDVARLHAAQIRLQQLNTLRAALSDAAGAQVPSGYLTDQ